MLLLLHADKKVRVAADAADVGHALLVRQCQLVTLAPAILILIDDQNAKMQLCAIRSYKNERTDARTHTYTHTQTHYVITSVFFWLERISCWCIS